EASQVHAMWVRILQWEAFRNLEPHQLAAKATGFDLYVDEDGVIRLNTRLAHGDLPINVRAPILLTRSKSMLSYAKAFHETAGHTGARHLQSLLSGSYRITGCHAMCRRLVARCRVCRQQRASTFKPREAPLPSQRFASGARPFQS